MPHTRLRRLQELEAARVAEEQMMEARRQQLMSEEDGYWRMRMAAEQAAEVAALQESEELKSELQVPQGAASAVELL